MKTAIISRSKSIIIVMLGTFSSRFLGFARNATIAFYFGAGEKADVLNFIQAIPLLLRRLAAEGSLETALVPELVRSYEQDPSFLSSKAIWRKLLAVQWCILLPLCLLLWLFPNQIIDLLTEFPKPEQRQLASQMLYYVSPYVFLLSQSVLLGALLSSQQRFTLSSFTPLFFSVTIIATTVWLQKYYSVFAVLWGMLAGIVLQLLFLLPPILRSGYALLPYFRLSDFRFDPAIKRICQVWLPLWFSTSLLALMQFVAHYLASQTQSGSISALTNALIFFQLPQGLIYASIAKVCLPQMSQLADPRTTQVLRYGLQQLLILLLPATLVLFMMSDALVAIAFQRGAFALQDTLLTAEVLRYYILGTLPIAGFRFLQQYLYAQSHKVQPLLQTFWVVAMDIPLSFYLIEKIGVIALPIANTFSYSVVGLYSYFITARYSHKDGGGLLCRVRWHRLCFGLLPKLLLVCGLLQILDRGLVYAEQYLFDRTTPNFLNNLRLTAQGLEQSQQWWWSQGGTLHNFGILAIHGLILLGFFIVLCRIIHIPLLKQSKIKTV